MLRPSPSLSLCALPLLLLGPHLIPQPAVTSAPGGGGGGGNEPPVCAIEYKGEAVTFGTIYVASTPPLTMVDLSGCSSFDPEGEALTFRWEACPGATYSDPAACDTTLILPTPAGTTGSCDMRLFVTDPQGSTTATYCRLNVEYFENTPPTCVLAEQEIKVYAASSQTSVTVTLDACASFDPDPQDLSFAWQGCPISTFSDPSACATEMTIDLTGQTLPLVCGARLFLGDGVVRTQPCRIFVTVLPQPDLDICPLGCPTPIGLTQPGTIRSVLTANAYFDVSQVDSSSLMLRRADGVGGQLAFLTSGIMDACTPVDSDDCADCPSVAPDGFDDQILLSNAQAVVNTLLLFNEPINSLVELEIVGKLLDGTEFKAQDCVTVVP